ncbi:hypothetical protein [Hymenobacter sublimis]|uniref:Uncharacterized protein n=1 Tax=Hymenobacter sublimis TaxID=2933777 RepID=A0ABY4JBG4_9BACT|nr:hypothetical protein [Hymenobacter sublimis]UPL49950.1 hypothetical protein MWH26_03335 [Hymenobacter sublimis]
MGRKEFIPNSFRPLFYYFILDELCVIIDAACRRILHNNSPAFHISTVFDVTMLCIVFNSIYTKRKYIIKLAWLLFIIVEVVSACTVDPFLTSINIIGRFTGNSLLALLALVHAWQLKPTTHTYPEKNPELVFSSLVLLYYTSTVLLITAQELYQRGWFTGFTSLSDVQFELLSLALYPPIRIMQIALVCYLLYLFPGRRSVRQGLPRWLRFRLGWRPPTEPPQYRVLSEHLIK